MSFVECVQVITQIVTASTAVVMAYFAYETYLRSPEQSSETEPEEAVDSDVKGKLEKILVFETSTQQTWLSVSEDGLSCRIDDARKGKGGPQWKLTKIEAAGILNSNAYRVNPGYKVKTGTFTLGPRKNWLYSKKLFPESDYLHDVLKRLLENVSSY